MATTRKKAPTAAQKATRAEFSRIMKSGGFAKRRKKNPVKGRSRLQPARSSGRLGTRSRQSALDPTLSPAASYSDGHDHGVVNNNPRARRAPMKTKRKANPLATPLHYACHIATSDGKAGRFLFAAKAKPDAVALAQAYASAKGKRVVIVGKAR